MGASLMPVDGCTCTVPWASFKTREQIERCVFRYGGVLCARPRCPYYHPVDPTAVTIESSSNSKGKRDFDGSIDGGGYKGSMDNPAKPPLSLISPVALWAIGRVLGKGAMKYARGNWMRGMSFSEVADAALRHLTSWIGGEDNDPETGESHLAHLGCCVMFLLHYKLGPRASEYARFDDRVFGKVA